MKKCSKCNRELSLSSFDRDSTKKDGLHYRCKECKSEYNKRYHRNIKGTEIIHLYHSKSKSKKRGLKFIPILINPLPKEIKVDYHHINNLLTIPLPNIIHRRFRDNDSDKHKEKCNEWIKEHYNIDMKKILNDEE